jgi:arginase family enzyme
LAAATYVNLDDAWGSAAVGLPTIDAREWGPHLRFTAPTRLVEDFYSRYAKQLTPFTLFGSGDFHHLTALWLRRVSDPVVVVSFDNHPDWDIRPPRWSCGGWVNRALELPQVRRVSIWGCSGPECWWPAQIFGNRAAEKAERLVVHPWADDQPPAKQGRDGAIRRDNWRRRLEASAARLRFAPIYITIDLDCLRETDAVTNWDGGWFSLDDLAWALSLLRSSAHIVGGDICGAYSAPEYARRKQRFAANWDHPKLSRVNPARAQAVNRTALERLWPILTQ